ncbi:uncharacterized protein BDR25DRAFT_314597 [Lindgomyces ingoldianus]|uniref:Uncharacterized protein n=1 Tax=Lindgomyces ingoldianus TaxID=673940 RepID=A0ACB6QU55_9PLEO|nr:uncharacterized protein BDR25DRAFT_314597 [Lindgomyces ingoldianus]KAF2470387.1 hypothetical protein BDR25DRAFT_314597 [Lindgomyces ingoldianus]
MFRKIGPLFLLLAIGATAQNYDTTKTFYAAVPYTPTTGHFSTLSSNSPSSRTGTTTVLNTTIATKPLVTTITSEGLTIVQTIGSTTRYSTLSSGSNGMTSTAITIPLVATITSGGQIVVQTTGFSTIYSALSPTVGGAASTAVFTSPLVTTITSAGQTFVQTTGFSTIYSAISSNSTSSSSNSASSSVLTLATTSSTSSGAVTTSSAASPSTGSSISSNSVASFNGTTSSPPSPTTKSNTLGSISSKSSLSTGSSISSNSFASINGTTSSPSGPASNSNTLGSISSKSSLTTGSLSTLNISASSSNLVSLTEVVPSTGSTLSTTLSAASSPSVNSSSRSTTSFSTARTTVSSISSSSLTNTSTSSTFSSTASTGTRSSESLVSLTGISSTLSSTNISESLVSLTSTSSSLKTGVSKSVTSSANGVSSTVVPPPGQSSTAAPPPSPTTSYSDEEIDRYLTMTSWDNFLVTSTLTTDTAISASQTSNSDWKKNFWLKTLVNGQPTDLPVVHCGCICKNTCDNDDDDDDAAALWIIYFNVPKIPNLQISLPHLPDFHLGGCMKIKVPVINIEIPLRKCPPVSDNGKHGHKDPDDPKGNNEEPDPNDPNDPNDPKPSNTPSSKQESSKSSTTSSSSSSSCSGAVVTDRFTQIICPSESASNCQTAIQTSTRSGCSLTGTAKVTQSVSSCSGGVVTDFLTRISCPTGGATGTQCVTAVDTGTRSGCDLTGTASVTVTASGAACARQSWPTSFGPGVGYSAPGSKYGTYTPPAIFGSITMSFSSMTVSKSSGLTGATTGSPPTTLSTVTISNSSSSSRTQSSKTSPSTGTESNTQSTSSYTSKSSTTSASDTGKPSESSTVNPISSSTTPMPTPTQSLKCENNRNQYWVSPETMEKGITDFCDEASKAKGWDDGVGRLNHKRIERMYNKDTDDQVVLLISSTTDATDKATIQINKDDCISNMTKIFEECPTGQDIPGIDWRHGGEYVNGYLDWILVTDKLKYTPGICTFKVSEKMQTVGQEHHWWTKTSINDAADEVVTPMGEYDEIYFDNRDPNKVPGLYKELEIEAGYDTNGDEMFHFELGNYQFSSKFVAQNNDKVPRCEVGEWSETDGVHTRDTNCWVYC